MIKTLISFVLALLTAVPSLAAPTRSIFDDDYTPPKSPDAPRSAPLKPSATDNPPAAAARHLIPLKSDQAAVRKILREVYANQLADHSIPARRRLTDALLKQVDKSPVGSADQFVLLAASIDAALDAVSLPLAFHAADRMAATFDIDALAVKADAATRLPTRPGALDAAAENMTAGLALTDQLADADDLAAAARVCAALLPVAAADPALRTEVVQRQRDLAAARDAAEKVASHFEKLKTAPDDPASNLAVGRYLCFVKGDWARGLPMLARGSDESLRAGASNELAAATNAAAATASADAWWELGSRAADAATRAACCAHAATIYKSALDKTDGLRRAQLEKRIADAAKFESGIAPASRRTRRPSIMTPREILTRFTFPNQTFAAKGDAVTGSAGDGGSSASFIWLKEPRTLRAFEFGFEIKSKWYHIAGIEIDGKTYTFSRGHWRNRETYIGVPGQPEGHAPGNVTAPDDWAKVKVVAAGAEMTFYYNGAAAASCNLVAPMTPTSQVRVAFSSHDTTISVRNVYLVEK